MTNMKNILLMLTASIFVVGCGEKIPVKEMALAKMEITRAMSVMAKKYAPQEIDEAEKKLLESHEFIKQDALDKSKDSAVAARQKAQEAYDKSIPLLAKDTLDIAKQSIEQAEVMYAEVLAESEYKEAKDAYSEAEKLYEQKSYYPSYEKSVEADGLAKEARNVSIGKKEILNKSIAEVKVVLSDAEKYNASTVAKEQVQIANDNLVIAEESYNNLELKKGFNAIEIAGTNADEAYLIALKETANGKIEGAEKLFSEAQSSDGALVAKDELKGAEEALNQSKTLFQDSKYKEAIISADESARLSGTVLGVMSQSAKEKIAGAEEMYNKARNSEGAAVAVSQLKGAGDALDLSKSLYQDSKYQEAIASAVESERLSKIVIDTKGKGKTSVAATGGKGTSGIFSNEYFTYKVRYIPERRDCLWRIAEKYYDNPFYWPYIYKANKDKIYNPDLIWPDMLLKVPKMKKGNDEEKNEPATENVKESLSTQEKPEDAMIPAPVKEEQKMPLEAAPASMEDNMAPAPVQENDKEALPEKAGEMTVPKNENEIIAPSLDENKEPAIEENTESEPVQENKEEAPAQEEIN